MMFARILFVMCLVFYHQLTISAECGQLDNHYGPFDYRVPKNRIKFLPRVEDAHFTGVTYKLAQAGADYELYRKLFKFGPHAGGSKKNTQIPADLDYTLRAFPNHPKALYAMSEYQRKRGKPVGRSYNEMSFRVSDCYYQRARNFVADDYMVYMLYGIQLFKENKYNESLIEYDKAEKLSLDNPELVYNKGLLLFAMKQYEKAKKYAIRAEGLGYPLDGLQKKLDAIKR